MTEVFIIPDGEHLAFYRQFGKLNRIEPIKLKTGEWCLPTRILPHLERTYTTINIPSPRFEKRKDATLSVINYARATQQELNAYPKRSITKDDLDSRYTEEVGVNGGETLVTRAVNSFRNLFR